MATWQEVSARLGRNDMPAALYYAVTEGRMTDPGEIAKGVTAAWTMAEFPESCAEAEVWVWLFDKALPTDETYLLDGVPRPQSELPEWITLYRGAIPERAWGMAWTDDRAQAEWFAHRLDGAREGVTGCVYVVTAWRGAVLARNVEARGESEWVLDSETFEDDDVTEAPPVDPDEEDDDVE